MWVLFYNIHCKFRRVGLKVAKKGAVLYLMRARDGLKLRVAMTIVRKLLL